jgi:hypothetical protein
VSVLRSRIMSGNQVTAVKPWGTSATPMLMPMNTVTYDPVSNTVSYAELVPLWAGDWGAGPYAAETPGAWGRVVPSGRP